MFRASTHSSGKCVNQTYRTLGRKDSFSKRRIGFETKVSASNDLVLARKSSRRVLAQAGENRPEQQ